MELQRPEVEQRTLETVRFLLDELGGARSLGAVPLHALLEKDLGLGSLERVELVSRLESEFGIELSESVISESETLNDLVKAILSTKGSAWVGPRQKQDAPSGYMPPPDHLQTLVEALEWRAQVHPHRAHIYFQEEGGEEQAIHYGDLYRDALALAGGLAARGLEPRDTAAIMLPSGRDFFVAFAGVILAGGVPVPLYPPFRLDRIGEYAGRQTAILANARTKLFITLSSGRSIGQLLRSRVPQLQGVTTVEDLVSQSAPAPSVEVGPADPAFIQYTSGSTGAPKGVLLTHRNLVANIRGIGETLELGATDVGASWLPLYHDMGLIGMWLTPLYYGVPVVIMSPLTFLARPERWLWAIHSHRATLSASPNFGYELCVRRIRDEALEGLDLSSWRGAMNGAEPVSVETMDRFRQRFTPKGFKPEAMMPVYGMAESSVALALPPLLRGPRIEALSRVPFETEARAVTAPEGDARALRFVSVGQPLKGHEVRIVDDEGGVLPERREGVLQFRGPSTMQGYYRNAAATEAVAKPGGWVDSGDRAFVADGEVFITGRVKDVVIRAGRNIYPHEAEEIAADVEGVRRGCVAAFGVRDERQGTEKLVVVVETRVDETLRRQSMTAAIQERLGELFGAPADDLVLVPPGSVPKTSSGKLRRSATKERYLEGKLVGGTDNRRFVLIQVAILDVLDRLWRAARGFGRWVYGIYAVVLSLAIVVPFWFAALACPSRRLVGRLVQFGARAHLFLSGCRFSVVGLAHLKNQAEPPVIFVSNHASYLDPLPIIAGLPLDFAFIVKREAGSWPIVGTFIRRLGHLLIDRIDPKESVESAEEVAAAFHQGRSVVFFAEGTFTRVTGLRPFKLGAFKLAAETGRPIVPLALKGTRRWLRDGTWLPRRSDLQLIIDEPLHATSSSLPEVVRLRDEAAQVISRHVGEPRLDLVAAGLPVAE